MLQLLGLGVDGFFIDQPDLGVAGRDAFLAINGRSAAAPRVGASHLDAVAILAAYARMTR